MENYLSEVYNFCIPETECNTSLPAVNIIKSDCVSTCFTPSEFTDVSGDLQCVSGYRIEILDNDGNKVEDFIDFGEIDCLEDTICFDGDRYKNLISTLENGPYTGNIIAIYDFPDGSGSTTTSSNFFPVDAECCLEDFELDVEYSASCSSARAYLQFCLDDFRGCTEDYQVSVDDVSI